MEDTGEIEYGTAGGALYFRGKCYEDHRTLTPEQACNDANDFLEPDLIRANQLLTDLKVLAQEGLKFIVDQEYYYDRRRVPVEEYIKMLETFIAERPNQ